MVESKWKITRTERDISPNEHLLKEKTIIIEGSDSKIVKELFDEEWNK